ncbi:MAG: tetratricopeptide repeat protein, partial [Myxococcota bacterium]
QLDEGHGVMARTVAEVWTQLGQPHQARDQLQDIVTFRESRFGPRDERTLLARSTLASAMLNSGDLTGARTLLLSTTEALTEVCGADHPNTLIARLNLGVAHSQLQELDAAEAQLEDVAQRFEARGHESLQLRALANLAHVSLAKRDLPRAEALQRSVLEARRRQLDPDHLDMVSAELNLLVTRGHQHGHAALVEEAGHLYRRIRSLLRPWHPAVLMSGNLLTMGYSEAGDHARAELILRRLHEDSRRALGELHPRTLQLGRNLAHTLYLQGQLEASIAVLEEVVDGRTRVLGAEHPLTQQVVEGLEKLRGLTPG